MGGRRDAADETPRRRAAVWLPNGGDAPACRCRASPWRRGAAAEASSSPRLAHLSRPRRGARRAAGPQAGNAASRHQAHACTVEYTTRALLHECCSAWTAAAAAGSLLIGLLPIGRAQTVGAEPRPGEGPFLPACRLACSAPADTCCSHSCGAGLGGMDKGRVECVCACVCADGKRGAWTMPRFIDFVAARYRLVKCAISLAARAVSSVLVSGTASVLRQERTRARQKKREEETFCRFVWDAARASEHRRFQVLFSGPALETTRTRVEAA